MIGISMYHLQRSMSPLLCDDIVDREVQVSMTFQVHRKANKFNYSE